MYRTWRVSRCRLLGTTTGMKSTLLRRGSTWLSIVVVLVGLSVTGCQWPRDAAGTLDRVRGGEMRVGVVVNPPWTEVDGDAVSGAESVLVHRFADSLGARVRWVPGSESELMKALSERTLDLVVGGLDTDSPWEQDAALTADYFTTAAVVAVPGGTTTEIAGLPVQVRAGSAEEALLADEGAKPVPVNEIAQRPNGPSVVPDWLVDTAGLVATGIHLSSADHVMAVPLGENGWQTTVEEFLLSLDQDEVRRLLVDADRAEG